MNWTMTTAGINSSAQVGFSIKAAAAATDTQEWRGSYPTPRRATVNVGY
jgi:hypothetical protein